jgi:hypothetical protein
MQNKFCDNSGWLHRAKKARIAAEVLTDADAKEVMLELSLFYLHLAQTDTTQAETAEGYVFGLGTDVDPH